MQRRTRLWTHLPLLTLLALVACDTPENGPAGETTGSEAAPPPAAAQLTPAAPKLDLHPAHPPVDRVAPDGKKTFEELQALLESHYVDGPLSEDELWTAATEGVLDRLIQLEGHRVNALLSPEEFEALMEGTRGSIVGIGVAIEDVAGVLVVRQLIPGGPAADSGLQPGDRILGIDGERLTGKSLHDSVMKIRGEAGTKVELFVQRDTEEWNLELTRSAVAVTSVESRAMSDGVGYLRLNGFSKTTAEEVVSHLSALKEAGSTKLMLDLRTCPGGLLDTALEVAELFLAPGKRIVTIRGVKGEEHKEASREDGWEAMPMVVLIGPKTASGAEILAGALGENDRALIIGQPTLGKGTVEAVHELSNGWAVKLSSARFFSPEGNPRQGQGVIPDIAVQGAEQKPASVAELAADSDPLVHAAIGLLATP